MARLSVQSEAVRGLARNVLVPLFLAEGSTAGVCKVLNDALQELGEARVIHPNRVHTLLSEDVGRGINETTLSLIERAATLLQEGRLPPPDLTLERLRRLRAKAPGADAPNEHTVADVSRHLGIPAAIAKQAIELDQDVVGLPVADTADTQAGPRPGQPDWTYQDTAVARCLDAFRRRPTGRIALILPTGAGKTRTALRVILEVLARSASTKARVLWITHRKALKSQAFRELRKLLAQADNHLPDDASILANRVSFIMVGDVARALTELPEIPALVVVDEAHHAAAVSYRPIFDTPQPFPVLLLTATPNRTDRLPIGIDEIAFTITYRELAERGAIVVPEFIPLDVPDFNWSPSCVKDLVDYVIDETSHRFTKVLVLAPRVDRVEEFYDALVDRLTKEAGHPLEPDDVGFIHGTGNSLGLDNDDFLARFAEKPRAVLVSAQMLLEGFDDPAIDTVVITYQTESVIKLMQAAGRCVRHAPGKWSAYVVQAHNPDLAYRFDQRWLYQEIDDLLRPDLIDLDYEDAVSLQAGIVRLLDEHRVQPAAREALLGQVARIKPGATCRLLIYGLPYYGAPERFAADARWGVFLETDANSAAFRGVFNEFCALGAHLSDPTEFLTDVGARYGIRRDLSHGSMWRQLAEVLTACYFAREELRGVDVATQRNRLRSRHGPTTWLRYASFTQRIMMPAELSVFLSDCYNRSALADAYLADPFGVAAAIKVPLPLGACEGLLLDPDRAHGLDFWLRDTRQVLRLGPPEDQFATLASRLARADLPALPMRFLARVDRLLGDADRSIHWLSLPRQTNLASQGDPR
ncbi:DEAD/DEAH box helicase [Methylobacterium oryzihabitans]|uniref:DEAD/DEAH box helicase n=1 Tax=Methylobacterium oryzihabitans TaxID=2499852 RepID=A0A3S2V8S7_9HYPH|nr:DEAD/DEAH box helicase family protein [Methylobacterium oryzihabitans]RVU18496.1 DEAD/DEAH box helicase [Methylobacterium oryzihabitans]